MQSRRNFLIFAIVALLTTPIVLITNHRYPRKEIKPFPDMTISLEKVNGHWQVVGHQYPNIYGKGAIKYIEAFPVDDQVPDTYLWRTNGYAHAGLYDEAIKTQTKMISLMESASNKSLLKDELVEAKKHLAELRVLKKSSSP
ncbi:MAG: hypothetical protein SFY67_17915 [Candidatus Melainabacteria bacterium]|nr:hypothetical protein [Candidatus Melainabacteria bacterium]